MNDRMIAAWMLDQVYRVHYLDQASAAQFVRVALSERGIVRAHDGSEALHPAIIKAFTTLAGDRVVWDALAGAWRLRMIYDRPERRAA